MNILVVSPDFLPNVGGVATMTHHIANSLAQMGHGEVHVLSPFAQERGSYSVYYTHIQDHGAQPNVMAGREWILSERPRVMKTLETVIAEHKIDRIISFHPHYYGQALMELKKDRAKRGLASPQIASVFHGLEILTCWKWPKIKQAIMQRIGERRPSHRREVLGVIKGSDINFCNSGYTQSLIRRTRSHAQSHVIGCGIPPMAADLYQDVSPTARKRRKYAAREILKLPQEAAIIGTLGRIVPHKNIEALIDLIAASPASVHGLIAGTGPHKNVLEDRVVALGLNDRIHFYGVESAAKKWTIIEALDQFTLLSKPTADGGVEGFGIVMLEAMIAGVPVISSGTGGMGEAIIDGATGLFASPAQPKNMLAISQNLLTNTILSEEIIYAAHARVCEQFLWTQVCKRMLKAWGEIASK